VTYMRTPLSATFLATASLGLLLAACAAPKNDENTTCSATNNTTNGEGGSSSEGGSSETGNDPTIATTNMSMTGPSEESGMMDGSTSISFIQNPDGGNVSNECDIWAQDCPEGEKCMPWDNAGGN